MKTRDPNFSSFIPKNAISLKIAGFLKSQIFPQKMMKFPI